MKSHYIVAIMLAISFLNP